jgi:hypothetical protein
VKELFWSVAMGRRYDPEMDKILRRTREAIRRSQELIAKAQQLRRQAERLK